MQYKVILVDVDDTLLDFRASARQALEKTLSQYGMELTETFWQTYWRINTALWRRLEIGELNQHQLFAIRFPTIFAALDIDLDPIPFETQFHEALHEAAVPFPGAADFLSSLDVPVYAATNGWQEQQEHRLALAGLSPSLSGVFSSERAGCHKPDVRFYEFVFSQLKAHLPDLKREEILMLGDNQTADVQGARDAGFSARHVPPGTIGEVMV